MKLGLAQRQIAVIMYEELRDEGLTTQQIADKINEDLGLNLEKSSYQKAYYKYKADQLINDGDEEAFQSKMLTLTRRDMKQKAEAKKLTRQRAIVDLQIKEMADKQLFVQAIEHIWGIDYTPEKRIVVKDTSYTNKRRIYAWGDPHWG